jgi:signal transduction histidine kinase
MRSGAAHRAYRPQAMRARSPHPAVADGVLAAVLVVAAQVELWTAGETDPVSVVAGFLGTAPMALRRRFPLTVVVLVMASVVALMLIGSSFFSYAQLIAMLVASYTVGAWATGLRTWAGLGVALGVGVTHSLVTTPDPELGDVVFPVVLLAGPWLAGRALRLWRERTAQLQRLTAELAHEREERAALAVTAERARIARELHDVLSQSLNGIVIHAEAADEALDVDPQLARTPLAKIQQTGRSALRETRRMLGLLRGPAEALAPLPGVADLEQLVADVRDSGLAVRLCVTGEARPLPPALELSVYRIVQQALANTLAHARAASADVVLRYEPGCLAVEVTDDGRGDGPDTAGSGYGVVGMRERAALFGGTLTAGPRPSGGFGVCARLPLDGASP